jgi:outer membrane protein TolC
MILFLLPRLRRLILPVLASLVLSVSARAGTLSVDGTMPEDSLPQLKAILQTALSESPTMLMQNIALAQSAANRYFSDAGFWPTLNASAGYGLSGGRTTSDPPSSSHGVGANYGIGFGQSLFQWGAIKATSDIGKLSQQIAERNLADAFRTLAMTLRSQYLSLIGKKVSLRNARYQLQLMETALSAQEEQLKDGTVAEGDLTAMRLNVVETRLNVERTVEDYDYTCRVFQRLAGLAIFDEAAIPADLPHPAYSSDTAKALLTAFLGGGVENTLQAQIYVLSLKQNDLNIKIVKTNLYYPKFSVGGNYSLANNTTFGAGTVSTTSGISYGISVGANVPLFNGFAQTGAKRSALATKRATEQQRRNYLDATEDSAENLCKQLDFTARTLELAEARRSLAQDAVRKMSEQVEEGTASKTVLEGVTANFNAADYYAILARSDYLNRWSDFVSLIGADPVLNAVPVRYRNLTHGK